ncbi:aspartic peptidase domain-containing protein [Lipomyces chichibuensis]|uniref:aspartic peptidase domain-containing protein n=1 Tax=Lipomyces chichibuensis TaxID=1546026 RepID=UPI00334339DC
MVISFPLTQRIATGIDYPHMVVPQQFRRQSHQYLSDRQPFAKSYNEDKPPLGPSSVSIAHRFAAYTVAVGVGTPPQIQSLLIDTGSSDLLVFSSASQQCRASPWGCGGGYNPVASSTYESLDKSFVFGFGNQSDTARGSFVKDDVLLGDYLVRGQQFALVEDSILDFDIEGVLGLGYKSMQQAEVKYDTVASKLYSYDVNPKPIYSLYLDSRHRHERPRQISEKSFKPGITNISECSSRRPNPCALPKASLDLGFVDALKHVGDLMEFIPCTSKHEFSVALSDITVPSSSASKPVSLVDKVGSGMLNVLLDSGTIGILITDNIADAIARRISPLAVYDNSLPGYRVPCSPIPISAGGYFEFTFSIDQTVALTKSKTVKVSFSELYRALNTTSHTPGDKKCMLDIIRESTYGIGNILGTAFLSSVYAVFDVEEHRVGIAQASYYNM